MRRRPTQAAADSYVEDEAQESKEKSKAARFCQGLKPRTVIRATDLTAELMLFKNYKSSKRLPWTFFEEANAKCPQAVKFFHEERLAWHSYLSQMLTRMNASEYQHPWLLTVGFK
jgi:hypothetical protein